MACLETQHGTFGSNRITSSIGFSCREEPGINPRSTRDRFSLLVECLDDDDDDDDDETFREGPVAQSESLDKRNTTSWRSIPG